jgi:hypothetical protein
MAGEVVVGCPVSVQTAVMRYPSPVDAGHVRPRVVWPLPFVWMVTGPKLSAADCPPPVLCSVQLAPASHLATKVPELP